MEVGKKTSKRRFTVNRSRTFSIRAEYVNVEKWELTITFNLTSEANVGVLVIKICEKELYML
jgi:hypothetical protein